MLPEEDPEFSQLLEKEIGGLETRTENNSIIEQEGSMDHRVYINPTKNTQAMRPIQARKILKPIEQSTNMTEPGSNSKELLDEVRQIISKYNKKKSEAIEEAAPDNWDRDKFSVVSKIDKNSFNNDTNIMSILPEFFHRENQRETGKDYTHLKENLGGHNESSNTYMSQYQSGKTKERSFKFAKMKNVNHLKKFMKPSRAGKITVNKRHLQKFLQ